MHTDSHSWPSDSPATQGASPHLIISGDGSLNPERIDIAHLVDIDGAIYPLAHGLIAGYDTCYLQSCNIEGFYSVIRR